MTKGPESTATLLMRQTKKLLFRMSIWWEAATLVTAVCSSATPASPDARFCASTGGLLLVLAEGLTAA